MAIAFAVCLGEDDLSAASTTSEDWLRGRACRGDCTGESPGLLLKVLGGDDPLPASFFFFTAFLCHCLRALEVCSSKIDLFIVDPI